MNLFALRDKITCAYQYLFQVFDDFFKTIFEDFFALILYLNGLKIFSKAFYFPG